MKQPRLRTINTASVPELRTSKVAFLPSPSPADAERERKRDIDAQRGTARQRGYDRAWERLRDAVVLERGCRCEAPDCGRPVSLRKRDATPALPVAHVDHIQSVASRPDLRLVRSNLRVLCQPCHDARTARDQAFGRGSGRPLVGVGPSAGGADRRRRRPGG